MTKLEHKHAEPVSHTFEGRAGWRAFLDPQPGAGKPGCALLPSWTLEVYCCDILRYRETYVDRPGAVEDARADADSYMAGRLPAWRTQVEGSLKLEDLDLQNRS